MAEDFSNVYMGLIWGDTGTLEMLFEDIWAISW